MFKYRFHQQILKDPKLLHKMLLVENDFFPPSGFPSGIDIDRLPLSKSDLKNLHT
jgi:hypothetical protein